MRQDESPVSEKKRKVPSYYKDPVYDKVVTRHIKNKQDLEDVGADWPDEVLADFPMKGPLIIHIDVGKHYGDKSISVEPTVIRGFEAAYDFYKFMIHCEHHPEKAFLSKAAFYEKLKSEESIVYEREPDHLQSSFTLMWRQDFRGQELWKADPDVWDTSDPEISHKGEHY